MDHYVVEWLIFENVPKSELSLREEGKEEWA